ncbi:MAG: glycoside hydrolase, partial [Flavisolibacter sp.]|nr:glycoside hydrolase [Flavisolibacter sp.]
LQPVTPKGYAFDYINADALLTRMAVDSNGKLMLPDGMRYEVLVLPQTDVMTVPVLRKFRDLIAGGATVVGPKPQKAPGLSGYPDADNEVKELANEIWGDLDGTSRTKRNYGKGKVFWGIPLEQVITALKIAPDVEYSGDLDSKLSWIHRKSGNTDIYFLVNSTDRPENVKARFRVSGKDIELWNPATGQIKLAGYTITGNYTTVPLQLKEREAVFVVFKNIVSDSSRSDWPELSELLTTVKGPWEVHFAPNLGAPEKITLEELTSWTAHADTGIKYFSGAATYTKTLQAEKRWFQPDKRILLDLGKVGDMAEVTINGKNLDLIWKAPYQVDVTEVLKPGKNQLTIKVTNEWTNRLIGDKLLGPDKKILDTYIAPFGGEYQLSESGLIGPVKILSVSNDKTIKN